jgi:hypothetical protein
MFKRLIKSQINFKIIRFQNKYSFTYDLKEMISLSYQITIFLKPSFQTIIKKKKKKKKNQVNKAYRE